MKSRKIPAKDDKAAAPANRVRTVLYSLVAILAVAGVFETTYLTALHLAGADVVCLASTTCSQVLQSPYASFHGVPLAGLGCLGYFTVFSCATLAAFGYRYVSDLLTTMVGIMFGTSLWLIYLQARVLHAFCEYCLLSAAIVFLLSGLLVAMPRRVEP